MTHTTMNQKEDGSQDRNRHREVPFQREGQSLDQNGPEHITNKDNTKGKSENRMGNEERMTANTFQPINEDLHNTIAPSM